jgi:integrase
MVGMPKDTRTRYQGVYARHQQRCRTEEGGRCNCKPSYYGIAYDRARRKHVGTRRQPTTEAARNARADLQARLDRGEAPATRGVRLTEAREQFVKAAREGRALNKHGRRYKRKAIDLIEGRLKHDVEPRLGRRRIGDIRRGEVQAIVDDLTPVASGSSVRGVVNSLRALYTWAEDRDLVSHNPAARVKLPAMNATPIERVATPAEFARLLAALGTVDALAYGLAAYAMARAEQIRRARWQDVDLKVGAIELGVDPDARKSDAAHRVIPAVPPLLALLKRAYLEAGCPDGGELLCPPRYRARKSGLLSTNGLAKRARTQWGAAKLEPITLQECRHTAATWLDAASVSPKIASYLMGHTTPSRQEGAATITLARYTHALPDDIERAREQLAAYLAQAAKEATG